VSFPPDPPITKRQLGWLTVCAGLGAASALLAADVFGAGQWTGLGPAQSLALGAAGLLTVLGLALLPLGDRPA